MGIETDINYVDVHRTEATQVTWTNTERRFEKCRAARKSKAALVIPAEGA